VSASNPARPEPTEIAGRFQVVKKLGAGAFGTVYKAKDKVLGRMLAIKTIRLEGLAASQTGLAEMLERFQREARVAAQLKHPNIVTIYDIGEAEGMSYISMEFIDGIGIDQVISESGRLPVERAAALGAQVADALDYAHKYGVVHRDIKPANIMIEPGDRVKVTDFGIAKPGDSAEHLTMTGSLLGTPSYMSPEQARGQKLDGRSDLFSLGCVVYEMLAGRKAFRGDSITALLFKIITEEPPALRDLDPTVPEGMIRLLEKALAKSPEARYQSGREMADDLLALTQQGSMPTLRSTDVSTLPPDQTPTIASAVTAVRGATTLASAATQPPAASSVTQPPALVPATVLTPPAAATMPPTVLTPSATPPAATTPAPTQEPPRARAVPQTRTTTPARSGPGIGLVLGLLGVGFVFLLAIAGGGWWLYTRSRPVTTTQNTSTPTTQPAQSGTNAEATPEPTPTEVAGGPTEAGPTPATETTPVATTPGTSPVTTPPAGRRSQETRTATNVPPPPTSGSSTTAPPGDYSFLNDVPTEGPDGRQLGDDAARSYRSGNSGGITNRRFSARPRVPRDLAPAERPAVGTLLHVAFAQQAYHRSNARYGTLHELKTAGLLRLDVPFQNGVFERAHYRFELTGGGGGSQFKITATPLTAARPFYTDENGFVLVDE
jgi:eukaryotic-like serine/threonine-protein kinase